MDDRTPPSNPYQNAYVALKRAVEGTVSAMYHASPADSGELASKLSRMAQNIDDMLTAKLAEKHESHE